MRKMLLAGAVALSFVAAPAAAKDKKKADTAIKRDPKGVKGISPVREDLAKGRQAFADGDHDGAIDAFDAAIAKDSARMMGYLLKAQTQLAKGDLEGARKTAELAKDKRGNEEETAKLLFFTADLDERHATAPAADEKQSKLSEALASTWDKVKERWTTYSAYLSSHTRLPDYQATATERKKQVDDRVKREKDYGAVAARRENNGDPKTATK